MSDNILSPILALCCLMKRPLWLNTRSTGDEVAGAEDFLKQAVQDSELCFLLHSFPRICREASALLTYEAQVVLHCHWQRHLAGNLWTFSSVTTPFIGGKQWLFKVFDSSPKTRTVRLLCDAKPKAKDTISWPRGSSKPRTRPQGLHLCKAMSLLFPPLSTAKIALFFSSTDTFML